MIGKSTLVLAGALAASASIAPTPLEAQQPTRLLVRVTSHDAKIIGSAVGGARVTIRDVASGQVLAEGIQEGTTGDTGLIMGTRERGSTVFHTEGAAGFETELMLSRPTLVEISGEGPLGAEHATQRATKTMLLIPGHDVLGEGVILELMGFTVTLQTPEEGASLPLGSPVEVRARVTMLCGCPTEPGGLWDADRIDVVLRALRGNEVVGEWPMEYSGETSEYTTQVRIDEAGAVTLQAIASDPAAGNFGMAERSVGVGG